MRKGPYLRRTIPFMVVLSLLLSACGGEPPAAPTAVPAPPTATIAPATNTPAPPTNTTVPPTPTVAADLPIDKIADNLRPATVSIKAVLPETPLSGEALSGGTGFVYDLANGYILTNNHVVEGASSLQVFPANTPKGRAARVVGRAQCDDLAVVKVDDTADLQGAKLGDSNALKPGLSVVALGYPEIFNLGNDLTVSSGIVSKLHHQYGTYQDLVQTDAAINHGNSGGPLVNRQGEVIGVNSLAWYSEGGERTPGINFAIAIDYARPIIADLQAGKNRNYLGLNLAVNQPAYQKYFGTDDGLVVAGVASGSPAAALGIQPADLLLAVEGKRITYQDGTQRQAQVCDILRSHGDGDRIKLTLFRASTGEELAGELSIGKGGAGSAGTLAVIGKLNAGGANGTAATPTPAANNAAAPTPTGTGSDNVEVLVHTMFADGKAGPWEVGAADGIAKTLDKGQYTLDISKNGVSLVSVPNGMADLADGLVAASVQPEGLGWAGVVARYAENGGATNTYFCGINTDSQVFCGKLVGGNETDLLAPQANAAIKANAPNTLILVATGNKFTVVINDQDGGSFTDDSLAKGIWGVMATTVGDSASFKAHYDEILIGKPK